LAHKSESVENLKLHVVKLRNEVSSYNHIFVDLKTRFKELNNSRQMLVTEVQNTKLGIAKENEKVRSLQKIMTSMKNQITTDQTTISQKSEKIETLKNKANELAGRLSEEKIKNSELTKLLSEASSKYEGDLYTIAKQNCESIKDIIATELKIEASAKESTKYVSLHFKTYFS
jgi:chromosome segregation ATPase